MNLLIAAASYAPPILLNICVPLTTLFFIAFVYFKWNYQYWRRKGVPHLEPTIPFGTFQSPYRRVVSLGVEFKQFYLKAKSNGWKHCGLYQMARPTYLLADLDLIKNVMSRDFQYFTDRDLYVNDRDDPIGSHLFSIGGAKWRKLRTKLTPTFSSGKMKVMFETLVACGKELETFLEKNIVEKDIVDIKDALERFTTDVIGTCAFGIECNNFKQETTTPFRQYARKLLRMTRFDALRLAFVLNWGNVARALRMPAVARDTTEFFTAVVTETVEYRERHGSTRKDFLQMMIDLKNRTRRQDDGLKEDELVLTMPEMVAQSFVFFLAGYETSSSTMTFALYELATHQEIQNRLRREIRDVLERHGNQITYDLITELKYMDQKPSGNTPRSFIIPRLCVKDYRVAGEDVIIEKGVRVQIPILGIHYDEDIYRDPDVFDPERFNDENKKTKVGLTSVLRKFKVTLNARTKVPLKMATNSVFLTADGGIWLDLEKL